MKINDNSMLTLTLALGTRKKANVLETPHRRKLVRVALQIVSHLTTRMKGSKPPPNYKSYIYYALYIFMYHTLYTILEYAPWANAV